MTNKELLEFETSERCTGCGYCLSGKYVHPLGYKWAIKRIPGKEEAIIIFGSVLFVLVLMVIGLIFTL